MAGPEPAGRISAVAGVPGDTTTYYMGAASGGIWKTTDGGRRSRRSSTANPCRPLGRSRSRRRTRASCGPAPGEAWAIRDSDVIGDGIYKSTDAGATWRTWASKETGRIGRIIVHPTNPDIVFACALGRATGPQQERGVFRTTDGGETGRACCSSTEDRLLGPEHRREGPARALRRHVGSRYAHVGDVQRRRQGAACTCRRTRDRRGAG